MKKLVLLYLIFSSVFVADGQWVSQTSGSANPLLSAFFITSNLGYCAEVNGAVIKTINGGATWNQVSSPIASGGITQLIFTSIDTGYAVCFNGILKTTNGGVTWQNNFADSNLIYSYYANFPSKMVGYLSVTNIAMDSAFIYKTIDGGNSWNIVFSQLAPDASNIYFTNNNIGFMNIGGPDLYKTIDGGVTWNFLYSNLPLGIVDFPTNSVGYAYDGVSIINKTTDAGNSWTAFSDPNTNALYSFDFTSIDTGYAVGGNGFSVGKIIKTVNGGLTWSVSLTISQTFESVHFPNSNTGYACGDGGIIYKYSGTAGINDFEELNGISIFPNPNTGIFKLSIDNLNIGEKYKVSVFDVLGNCIYQMELSSGSDIDISNQSKGIYFVEIENENGVVMKKIVVE